MTPPDSAPPKDISVAKTLIWTFVITWISCSWLIDFHTYCTDGNGHLQSFEQAAIGERLILGLILAAPIAAAATLVLVAIQAAWASLRRRTA